MGPAAFEETLSTASGDSKRLRSRRRQRTCHERHRAHGALGPSLSSGHRRQRFYRPALRFVKNRISTKMKLNQQLKLEDARLTMIRRTSLRIAMGALFALHSIGLLFEAETKGGGAMQLK